MKVKVNHSKLLNETQFDGIKGSPQHAAMSMNRVWVNYSGPRMSENWLPQKEFILAHLAKVCRNYYFVGRPSANNDVSLRIYFLSKKEMEDFIIWSKLALPNIAKVEQAA